MSQSPAQPQAAKPTWWRDLPYLLPLSYALFAAGYLVDQAMRWSDPLAGLRNGLFQLPLFTCPWVFFALPIPLVIDGFYRMAKARRFRRAALLTPAALVLIVFITRLAMHPTTPATRLADFASVHLPASAQHLQTWFTGGGRHPYADSYAFTCSAEDIAKFIADLQVVPDTTLDVHTIPVPPVAGWPAPADWPDTTVYARTTPNSWHYVLVASPVGGQIYLRITSPTP